MAPRTRTTALKTAPVPPIEAQPTSSGRPRTLSTKQQQLGEYPKLNMIPTPY